MTTIEGGVVSSLVCVATASAKLPHQSVALKLVVVVVGQAPEVLVVEVTVAAPQLSVALADLVGAAPGHSPLVFSSLESNLGSSLSSWVMTWVAVFVWPHASVADHVRVVVTVHPSVALVSSGVTLSSALQWVKAVTTGASGSLSPQGTVASPGTLDRVQAVEWPTVTT